MFLSEPSATSYDINFELFGFQIRVHPAFFVLPLLLGASLLKNAEMNAGVTLLVLIVVFFLSILVHELGHAFAFRYFGQPARIVLYWMGGLAIPDSGGSWSRPAASLTSQQQIIVSLAGPIFGFLLAALLIGVVYALNGSVSVSVHGILPSIMPTFPAGFASGPALQALALFLYIGILVNVFLNLLNLAPVFPLDGGQVARQLFLLNDSHNGLRQSMLLSVIVGAAIAFVGITGGGKFIGIFFGFMAWSNYMSMQQMGGGGYGGGYGGSRPW